MQEHGEAPAGGSLRVRAIRGEEEWQAARRIRTRVFVEEQSCAPEEEWDEHDATSRHLLAFVGDDPAGTARWRTVAYEGRLFAKLERVALLPAYRGRGLGRQLVAAMIEDVRRAGFEEMVLHAQAHLESFYATFGFERVSDVFMEADIPHVKMIRRKEEGHAR